MVSKSVLSILKVQSIIFLLNGPIPASFCLFLFFHIPIQVTNIHFEQYKLKKHRWYAWDSNRGGRMEGADESTELWRHPKNSQSYKENFEYKFTLLLFLAKFSTNQSA